MQYSNEIKRVTRVEFNGLKTEYDIARNEKKQRISFFTKWVSIFDALKIKQDNWIIDKIEKQDFCEKFNELGHDMLDDIERFIDEVESDTLTRNWGAADWSTRSLISNNID